MHMRPVSCQSGNAPEVGVIQQCGTIFLLWAPRALRHIKKSAHPNPSNHRTLSHPVSWATASSSREIPLTA